APHPAVDRNRCRLRGCVPRVPGGGDDHRHRAPGRRRVDRGAGAEPRVNVVLAGPHSGARDDRPVQSASMTSGHLLGELVTAQAATAPDTVAVHMKKGERLTFGTLDKRSNRLGRALVAMGIEPRQRVALLCCENHPGDLMVAYVGVQKAGAVSVVLPPAAATDDIAVVLRLVHPRLVI